MSKKTPGQAMKFEGVAQLQKTVNAIAATLSGDGAKNFVERGKECTMRPAIVLRDRARDMAPEISGRLKRSLYAAPLEDKVGAAIGVEDCDYAPFVEFGTSRAKAHPFLRPAINATRAEFAGLMAPDLSKLIADVASANAAHPPVTK